MSYEERVEQPVRGTFSERVRKPRYVIRVEDYPEPITPGKGDDVDNIVRDYMNHVPVMEIFHKYDISSGQLTSHLSARGIERRMTKRREQTLFKKLAKYTVKDIQDIIQDYEIGVPIQDIYDKYEIHKNGLYYLLDTNDIERRGRKRRDA